MCVEDEITSGLRRLRVNRLISRWTRRDHRDRLEHEREIQSERCRRRQRRLKFVPGSGVALALVDDYWIIEHEKLFLGPLSKATSDPRVYASPSTAVSKETTTS